jgi:hypothetical protein
VLEGVGPGECASNVTSVFVDVARDHACWSVRAALGLEGTLATIADARHVPKPVFGENASCRRQELAHRADVDIAILVEREVSPREGAVLTHRLVDNRDVRRNLLLVDDPIERRSRSVGRIGSQPRGLQSQPLLGPVDHRLGGADLRLANGARRLDVDNHSKLHIDEIVIGVGEKRRSAHRPRPLGGRIRRRNELRRDLARRTKGRVIEGRQILLHRAACVFGSTLLVPLRSRNRTLLVGIRRDQAGIDREPFAADQPCRDAGLNHVLEDAAENVTVAEPLIARPRERRMIRDLVFDREPAEPAIGHVHLHITAQRPL